MKIEKFTSPPNISRLPDGTEVSGTVDPATGGIRVTLSGGGTEPAADVNLADVGGSPITLGQKTSANSVPVVIASDGTQATAANQTAVQVTAGSITGVREVLYDAAGNAVDYTTPVQTYGSNSFLNVVAGTATTTVKSGAGSLIAVVINTKGASSNTLTIYDNTAGSGTVIAIIDTTAALVTLTYNVAFSTGLTLVSATGTGANYTAIYR